MADSYWTGLGTAAGTTISSANVNASGNVVLASGHSLVYSVSGTPASAVYTRQPPPVGSGLFIQAGSSVISRLDLTPVSGLGGACQVIYTPSAAPTTADATVILARNSSANMAQISHTTTGFFQVRNSGGASPITGGVSPTATPGHTFQIDLIVSLNSGTPSTSNGRIIGRVLNLTNPSWNTTGEFFIDSGYTENVGITNLTSFRVAKVNSPSVDSQTYFTNVRWGERLVNVSTDSTVARQQFISSAPATGEDQYVFGVTAGSWASVGGAVSATDALSDTLVTTYMQSPVPPSSSSPLLLRMGPLGLGGIVFRVEGTVSSGSATRQVTVFKSDGSTQIYQTSYSVFSTTTEQSITLDSTALSLIPSLLDRLSLVVRIVDVPA